MSEEEKLKIYLKKIQSIATENLHARDISALDALKQALKYVESEMTGY